MNRCAFEQWISIPPYERDIYRFPDDELKEGWPGDYRDKGVMLAWAAWCASAEEMISNSSKLDL